MKTRKYKRKEVERKTNCETIMIQTKPVKRNKTGRKEISKKK